MTIQQKSQGRKLIPRDVLDAKFDALPEIVTRLDVAAAKIASLETQGTLSQRPDAPLPCGKNGHALLYKREELRKFMTKIYCRLA